MAISQEEHLKELDKGYRFDWKDPSHPVFEPKKGLSAAVVDEISARKGEPDWMRKRRQKALRHFEGRPMPWWGADLSDIDFDNLDKGKATSAEDIEKMLENIPTPSGAEASEMIPWLLHIVEKATNQPAAVIDQLAIADLMRILGALLPGMVGLANFQRTSGSGGVTSPGSSGGPPLP